MKRHIFGIIAVGGALAVIVAVVLQRFTTNREKGASDEGRNGGDVSREVNEAETIVWPKWNPSLASETIERLRALKCPENYIEDILISESNRDAARDISRLLNSPNAASASSLIRTQRFARLTQSMGSGILAIDALIGLPYLEGHEFPKTQVTTTSVVLQQRDEKLRRLRAKTHGFITGEDQKEIENIEKETLAELQRTLTPMEFLKYEVDKFSDSDFGRDLVSNFNASEAELAGIIEYNKAQALLDSAPDFQAAQELNKATLKSKLGEERFRQFMRFKDPGYREIVAFAKRYGLDPGVPDQVIQLRNAAMKMSVQIAGSGVDPNHFSAIAGQASQTYRDHLSKILGPNAEIFIREAKLAGWVR